MAVTGLILIIFLLVHMWGNLKIFMPEDNFHAFDFYAEWLKGDILYPLIPSGWFIWIFRAFMVAAIALHMYSAIVLWDRSVKARGQKYQHTTRLRQTYAARTMRWGGLILGGFLLFHLLQFTVQLLTTGFNQGALPHEMFINSFQIWWVFLAYALWILVVCMHVRHGFWSAFTTLGANLSKKAEKVLNGCAYFVAVLLYIGFMLPPLFVLLRLSPFGG